MIYQNTLAFAQLMDERDPLKNFRDEFFLPQHNGHNAVYLCGNSLGLQPRSAGKYVQNQLDAWQANAVEGWFTGNEPWLQYHKPLLAPLSQVLGASEQEITIMNSLTVNLHLMMVSFYQPSSKRFKILMEAGAFPSDQYAVESQVRFHGFDPKEAIIEVTPRAGELILCTEDIIKNIEQNADSLALVLFSGVNYYTGQLFDMEVIAEAGRRAGAYVGFDLAHAAGNVPLELHKWGADFACWCSYKYLNSGPGGISGAFVHERHFNNAKLNRFAGWWGYRRDKQFLMASGFEPELGAEGWNVSTAPIMLLALHKASLDVFARAGLYNLRSKSELLTGYLEFLIADVNQQLGYEAYTIITPADRVWRGCQLSVICKDSPKQTFNFLATNGVIGDWREPDVIRLSPVPLYNTFADVYNSAQCLFKAVKPHN